MFPTTTSGKGIGFRLFGFPVRIEPFFFVVIALLGFNAGSVARVVVWAVVVFVSIMWHELGHAFAARRLGASPSITLHGFGGLTHWRPPRNPTRWNLISVAIAGPVAGVILGALVWLVAGVFEPFADADVRFFVTAMLWVNLGWGLLNLLPVLPLDGGHVLQEMLPGSPAVRTRRAAMASVVFGVVVAIGMLYWGLTWGAMVFGWAVASNLSMLSSSKQSGQLQHDVQAAGEAIGRLNSGEQEAGAEVRAAVAILPSQYQVGFKLAAVEAAVFGDMPDEARDLLNRMPGQADPALYALVSAAETHGAQGVDELSEMFARKPSPYRARWLALGLWHAGRLPDVVSHLAALDRGDETEALVIAARDIAEWAGDGPVLAQLTGLAG